MKSFRLHADTVIPEDNTACDLASEAVMKNTGNRKIKAQTTEETVPGGGAYKEQVDPSGKTQRGPAPYGAQPNEPNAAPGAEFGNYPDPTGFLMEQINKNPGWAQSVVDGLDVDIINQVKKVTQPFWEGMHLNPDEIDWTSLADEILAMAGISGFDTSGVSAEDFPEEVADPTVNLKAIGRRAAFIAAEYVLGRRMLGRRCAADSPAHDLHEWAIRVKASADTFSKEEFAYYAQVLKEAKIAMDAGDSDVAAELVKYVRRAFEVDAAGNWDPSLFQEDPQLEPSTDPQEQSNQYWGEAGQAPQQMLDPNMFDPSLVDAPGESPQQLQSDEYWSGAGRGPKPVEMLSDSWVDPSLGQGIAPQADPASQDYWESMGVAPQQDVPKKVWSKVVAVVKKMAKQAAEEEERELVKFTPPNYDLVLGDMVKAEKEGYDTFPRPYIHVLKNYIMARVATASENAWLPHLVNDGFVINRMDTNRGRGIKASKIAQDTMEMFSGEEYQKGEDRELMENTTYRNPGLSEEEYRESQIPVVIDVEKYVSSSSGYNMNGTLEEFQSADIEDIFQAGEAFETDEELLEFLQDELDVDVQALVEGIENEDARHSSPYRMYGVNTDAIYDALREDSSLVNWGDLTENWGWWGPDVGYTIFENPNGDDLLFAVKGGGASGYTAFKLPGGMEYLPIYDVRLEIVIKTNKGDIMLDAGEGSSTTYTVYEDETGTFEKDAELRDSDLEDPEVLNWDETSGRLW